MKTLIVFILCLLLFSAIPGRGQIRLSAIEVDNWIKANFSGQGVVIGNVSHRGYPLSVLSFSSSGEVLQVPRGLILSSGNSFNVAGYNNSHNQSSTFGDAADPETDSDLAQLISQKLYDICSIEFDFVPMDNSIQFSYQFGSDEYPEYVDSPYNDIFAFIVSDGNSSKNIALIPATHVPVSINTVNFKSNQEYFIDNNLYKQVLIRGQERTRFSTYGTFTGKVLRSIANVFTASNGRTADRTVIAADPELLKTLNPNLYRNLRYDGITKKLVAQTYVAPYKKYHLKIVIADVSDNIYDSGVFIEDRSLTAKKDPLQPGFKDYPDLSKIIDPNLILQGKTLEEIIPTGYIETSLSPADSVVEQPAAMPDAVASSGPAGEMENLVVHFDFDKSTLKESELRKLRDVIERYKKVSQHYAIRISGHTDSIGSMSYNLALSRRRSDSVNEAVNKLLGSSIAIPAEYKSFTEPVADNSSDLGRQANRRVELVFVRKN